MECSTCPFTRFHRSENKKTRLQRAAHWPCFRIRHIQLKAISGVPKSTRPRLLLQNDMFSCQSLFLHVLLASTKVPAWPVFPGTILRLLLIVSRVVETKAPTAGVIQVSRRKRPSYSPPVSDSNLAAPYRHRLFQYCKLLDISSVPSAGLLKESIKTIHIFCATVSERQRRPFTNCL